MSDLALTVAPVHAALLVYATGVLVALFRTDARWPTRVALAFLWPLGLLAFLVTTTILLLASLIAFPVIGAIVLALALAWVIVGRG